ncbi:hypothetical protein GGX14DRAFT_559011 [Mycena pura]|uniref:Uncharacterized protein n=1 Tax=Mycena pura TaxID=153505 RepID=A0AAD6VSL3_9AGAR|nr:hypothetical protein GGX14DRAFT_559011 [Mycena pura]
MDGDHDTPYNRKKAYEERHREERNAKARERMAQYIFRPLPSVPPYPELRKRAKARNSPSCPTKWQFFDSQKFYEKCYRERNREKLANKACQARAATAARVTAKRQEKCRPRPGARRSAKVRWAEEVEVIAAEEAAEAARLAKLERKKKHTVAREPPQL